LPLVNVSDVVDRTDPRAAQTTSIRILLPISGKINASLFIPDDPTKADPAAFITKVIDNYVAMGNSGMFRLVETPTAFHVVPARMKDISGKLIDVTPIFDTKISFPEQERSVYMTLKEICTSLQHARRTRVEFMSGPGEVNLLTRRLERIGATNEEARKVLLPSLNDRELLWRGRVRTAHMAWEHP
jgi:hypothetical protein